MLHTSFHPTMIDCAFHQDYNVINGIDCPQIPPKCKLLPMMTMPKHLKPVEHSKGKT